MPTLDDEQLANMRDREPYECPQCQKIVHQNYCRQCDEFYTEGHAPDCPSMKGPYSNDHVGHRTY